MRRAARRKIFGGVAQRTGRSFRAMWRSSVARWALLVFSFVLVWPGAVQGTEPASVDVTPLRVGTKEAPPFVVRGADGALDGPSLELWRGLAEALGVTYTIEERDLAGLLDGVRDGSLDVAIAAITVTSEREATLDFSHPYHTSSLAIAARRRDSPLWAGVLGTLLSVELLQLIALLAAVQLVVGTLVWILERRANPRQFGDGGARGLLSGFWWSTVTMTTVGYGDKAPVTVGGRVVALCWMLCSVVILSTVTATIASQMTVGRLDAEIDGPSDLVRFRVAVVSGTTSERYVRGAGLDFREFVDLGEAMTAVVEGEVDVVVHDESLLEYELQGERSEVIELLPPRFQRQDYAIALPEGSTLREQINRSLPDRLAGRLTVLRAPESVD